MSAFRGSDDDLDREITAVQRLIRVRLGRANRDMKELELALRELRHERRRRQTAAAVEPALETESVAT